MVDGGAFIKLIKIIIDILVLFLISFGIGLFSGVSIHIIEYFIKFWRRKK